MSSMKEQILSDMKTAMKTRNPQKVSGLGMKDMGKVMQAVLTKTKNTADNKKVSEIVKSLLQ